jgi:hypothetical protein
MLMMMMMMMMMMTTTTMIVVVLLLLMDPKTNLIHAEWPNALLMMQALPPADA